MAENTNTEREAFEAWYCTTNWPNDLGRHEGRYMSNIADASWQAWQARASLSANAGSEPAATVFTMEALTPGGGVKYHATVHKPLPAGTKLYLHPSPPEGMVGGWMPIATAPEGQMVVVGWLDPEDAEHPERHDFDLLEDGCWQQWHEHAEHVEVIGGHGVSYTPPYTVWMPVSPIPTSSADSRKGE